MRLIGWSAGLGLVLFATDASAHSSLPGMEGLYVGLLHPFSTPSQAMMLAGIGLLVGSFATARMDWQLVGFLTATLVGVIFGDPTLQIELAMYLTAVVACGWAALGPGKLRSVAAMIAAFGGLMIGFQSIPDPGPLSDRVFTMTGSVIGANIGLLYICGLAVFIRDRFKQDWVGIVFRVVAAWVAAISLVMLALRYAADGTVPAA